MKLEKEKANVGYQALREMLLPQPIFILVTNTKTFELRLKVVTDVSLCSKSPPAICFPIAKKSIDLVNINRSKCFSLVTVDSKRAKDLKGIEKVKETPNLYMSRFRISNAFYIDGCKIKAGNEIYPWAEFKVKEIKRMIGYDSCLVIADLVHISNIPKDNAEKILRLDTNVRKMLVRAKKYEVLGEF